MGITHEVIEDADTFEGNSLKKAREVMNICQMLTLADDSGIMVEALGGLPGVYSSRFASNCVKNGLPNDDDNNQKLLKLMENQPNRKAKFVCALSAVHPNGKEITVIGECHGEIAYKKSGSGGFGYDCLFYLPEYKKTMADISDEEKNKISHRAKAMREMVDILNKKDVFI